MAFGGGFGGGFGQSNPFQSTNTFSGSPGFGVQSSSPFGSGISSSAFGFGNSQTGFGVSSGPFGGGGGGAPFGGFGSPMGSTQMMFGAQPSSSSFTFGQSNTSFNMGAPFGQQQQQPSSPFGGGGMFGRPQSSSAFGFGQSSQSSFNIGFGQPQSSSPFGFGSSGFGNYGGAGEGTSITKWQKTSVMEGSTQVQFMTVSAMLRYDKKSLEELRFEDYEAGRKSRSSPSQNSFMVNAQSSSPLFSGMNFGQQSSASLFNTQTSSPFQVSSQSFFNQQPFSTSFNQQPASQPFGFQQSSSPFQVSSSMLGFIGSSNAFQAQPFSSQAFSFSSQPFASSGFGFQQSSAFKPFTFNPSSTAWSFPPASTSSIFPTASSAPLFAPSSQPFFQQSQPMFSFTTTSSQPLNQPLVQVVYVNANPYGSYPTLPQIPPPKEGITAEQPQTRRVPPMRAFVPHRRIISSVSLKSRLQGNVQLNEAMKNASLVSQRSQVDDNQQVGSNPLRMSVRKNQGEVFKPDPLLNFDEKDQSEEEYVVEEEEETTVTDEGTGGGRLHFTSAAPTTSITVMKNTDNIVCPDCTPTSTQSINSKDAGPSMDGVLPILTDEQYYIRPSLLQLKGMVELGGEQELKNVSNFTIGCHGIGNLVYLEPVDIRGLDVCRLVKFQKGGIEVFQNEGKSPQVGTGLNKPAQITFLNMYAEDPETGEPLTDAPSIENFRRRLEKVCQRQNAKNSSYNQDTFQWKLQVDHFSRYGLAFDKELEEELDDEEIENIQNVINGGNPHHFSPQGSVPFRSGVDANADMQDDILQTFYEFSPQITGPSLLFEEGTQSDQVFNLK